jgi:hypothetical protein
VTYTYPAGRPSHREPSAPATVLKADDIQIPILHCLNKRAHYVKDAGDWDWVIRDPVVGRFATALYVLGKEGKVSLSEKTRQEIAKSYWNNKARWLLTENRLKQVVSAFEAAGVEVIPLKGAALLGLLYKDSGLRSMSDIDLLVRPDAFLAAVNFLGKLGFKACPKDRHENITWFENLPRESWPKELSFSEESGLSIELHQQLINPWFLPALPVNMDAIWERSIPFTYASDIPIEYGKNLWKRNLSTYDTLAYLCLHLGLHGLQFPQSYLDIDLWVRNLSDTWDWDRFLDLVDQWRIRSVAYHVLSICKDLMGTPLPDGLLKRLDPGWLARIRVKTLISTTSILADRPSLGKRYPTLVKLALIDSLPSIMATLIKLAFPDKAWREHNPSGHNLLGHWLHVLHVVKRGD